MVTKERTHRTVVKSRSKNRPFSWTDKQKEAHEGNKPGFKTQLVLSENRPEFPVSKEASLKFRLNLFLVNVGVLVQVHNKRGDSICVQTICKLFIKNFWSQTIDREKLFFFFDTYTKNYAELDRTFPFPFDLVHGEYLNRKEEIEKLRKQGVEELVQILKSEPTNAV